MRRARHIAARISIIGCAFCLGFGLAYGKGWVILAAVIGITSGIVSEVSR